jgi:DUF2889 family protein
VVCEAGPVAVSPGDEAKQRYAHWADHPDLFPPDPDLPPLHQREYQVRAWALDESTALVRGAVMDVRPGPVVAEHVKDFGVSSQDQRPLPIHHMVVDLHVGFPDLVIREAQVVFEVHPQPGCPSIAPAYEGLVGLSVSRGFTHKVREMFGGPRGCTHTTALLQAMAPVVLQCVFAMREPGPRPQRRAGDLPFMRDTCHVWSTEGEIWQGILVGKRPPLPLTTQQVLRSAGVSPDAAYPTDTTDAAGPVRATDAAGAGER